MSGFEIRNPVQLPAGSIILWYGTIATIPSGWQLCNGTNGTPDLRNKFIVCANADSGGAAKTTITGAATQSGGTAYHAHTVDISSGSAQLTAGTAIADAGGAGAYDTVSNITGTPVSLDSTGISVPYYALAYIMKL